MNLVFEFLFTVTLCIHHILAAEFTFELPDRDKQCFYETLSKGVKSTIEYQVITGGNYDVDVLIKGPSKNELYNQQKKQYDSYNLEPTESGVYQVCFSNEFSTFTHKTVYFEWKSGPEEPMKPDMDKQPTALTMMETNSVNLHEALNVVSDYQTHNRLRESSARSFAEELNERVLYWSLGQSILILLVGVGQVIVLKSFFSERKPTGSYLGVST